MILRVGNCFQSGQSLADYSLILALVVVASIGALTTLGNRLAPSVAEAASTFTATSACGPNNPNCVSGESTNPAPPPSVSDNADDAGTPPPPGFSEDVEQISDGGIENGSEDNNNGDQSPPIGFGGAVEEISDGGIENGSGPK